MWEDPIVAEVHRAREKLVAESNYDLREFFEGVRKRQAESGGKLVFPPRQSEQPLQANGNGQTNAATSEVVPAK